MLDKTKLTGSPGIPGAGDAHYASTRLACAQQWAAALGAYAAAIMPASTTVGSATTALVGQLDQAFSKMHQPAGWAAVGAAMDQALRTWAGAVAVGMTAGGWSGTPPLMPVGFASLFAQPYPATRDEAVKKIAARVDQWMRSGTAKQIAPPYAVVPWS